MTFCFKSPRAANCAFLAAASVILGFLIFFWLCGPRCLDPTNIVWTGEGDAGQHYIGWLFYRYADWTFPVGLSPDWGMENAVSVIFADALPFFAIPFKVVRNWLPEPFQYYGLWFLLCFVLSAFFTMRLLAEYKAPRTMQVLAAFLAAASPILLLRIPGHHSLTGHWLILWALGLVLSPRVGFRWGEWGWLLCTSLAVHPYFSIMSLLLFAADGVGRELVPLKRSFDRRRLMMDIVKCGLMALLLLFTAWQIGLIGLSNVSIDTGGFGFYKSNLNTLVNPFGFSAFLKDWPVHPGEYEGFGYLGLGVMLLLVAAAVVRSVMSPREKVFAIGLKPLALVVLFMMLLAVTGFVGFNNWSWKVFDCSQWKAFNVFRASGRFIWLLWYFLLLAGVLTLSTAVRRGVMPIKALVALMLTAVALQAADLHQANHDNRRRGLMAEKSTTFFSVDPRWQEVATSYDSLRVLHNPGNGYAQWRDIAYLAGIHHMKTNTGYWARTRNDAVAAASLKDDENLRTGRFPARTAYVVTEQDVASLVRRPPADSTLATLNGLLLLLPHWHGDSLPSTWPALKDVIANPELNCVYRTKSGEAETRKLLATGWSGAEPWGTWSDGQTASLMLVVPEGATELVLTAHPFIASNHREQRVIIRAPNGEVLEKRTLSDVTDLRIPLDERVLEKRDGVQMAFISLELPDAATPASLGVNGDQRLLGLGLREWKVTSKP